MIETKVAKRYAKSLIDLSRETGHIDAVGADMKLFVAVCEQNRDLTLLLSNPIIHAGKKLSILTKVFEGKMNKLSISFFDIITRKGREAYLEEIAKEFVNQYKRFKGIQTAVITSAVGLDDALRSKVYSIIKTNLDSEVELIEKVDKNLIGGFVLRMEDKQYDASIASDLRKLTKEFAANPYTRKN
ncbi:MAG: ATP synthase F1 subunit delta [Bacteroidetes bacterium]|nr:ATP synthase F1 subunit delta [Bacteroidota bacterium]